MQVSAMVLWIIPNMDWHGGSKYAPAFSDASGYNARRL